MVLNHKNIVILFLLTLLTPQALALSASISDFNPTSHWTCDETSGIRYDSNTTNSNDLTDNNTVGYATGKLGNACDFETSNSEYLSITDADQIGLGASTFTYSLWVNMESTATHPDFFSRGETGSRTDDLEYYGGVFYYGSYSDASHLVDAGNFSKSFTLSLGTWYHIVIVRDVAGNNCDMYINGSDQSINCTTLSNVYDTAGIIRIGKSAWGSAYFDGLMDEISWFPTALTAGNVTTLYNSGTPLPYTSTTSSSSPEATTTSSTFEDDNILFMLAMIIFFMVFSFTAQVFAIFKKANA